MDPLSITAGILAVLDTTEKVIKYGLDFVGAPKEIWALKEDLETLESLLTRLMACCEDTSKLQPDEEPLWLRGLWEVRSGRFDKDGVWVFEYKGMIAQLKQVIEEMAVKLNPTRDWKRTEAYQRSTWHYRKDTFKEMQATVTRCCVAINTILALNNDETLTETLDLMKESTQNTKIQLAQIDKRMSIFEANQIKQEERRIREEEDREREDITAWLSPFSFIAKQDELWANCFRNTGDWLWQDRRFRVWAEGKPWFLRCVGAQGVGKTVLSSILTHHLPSKPQLQPPVLSIYLNYKSSDIQTLPYLIGSLLKQLIQLDEAYPISNDLRSIYKKARRLKLEPISYFTEIRRILVNELNRFERFYIVVDGFDELSARDRVALQRELRKLNPQKGSLVITTRPISEQIGTGTFECNRCHNIDLKMAFRCIICDDGNYDLCYDCKGKDLWCLDRAHNLEEPYVQIEIQVQIPYSDIENYVKWELGMEIEDGQPASKDDRDTNFVDPITTPFQDLCQSVKTLPELIVAEVTKKANGRFLFARLYMDSLRTKSNVREIKRALKSFPDTIDDIYTDAMHRIQAQELGERKTAFRILGLLTHARRPLALKELQHALAAVDFQSDDSDAQEDFEGAIDQPKRLLGSTSALIVLEEEGTQVRLIHRSLEEYLLLQQNSERWCPRADIEIAKACMNYLDLVLPRHRCQDDYYIDKNKQFPFLQYASQYWGDHVCIASISSDDDGDVKATAQRLLGDPQRKDACLQAAWVTNQGGRDTWDVWRNVDKLHICAWYGLTSIFREIYPERGSVDVIEPKYGQTPLMYACRKGHVDIARHLLSLGASQQLVSARGRTALFEAIFGHRVYPHRMSPKGPPPNHCEIVRLLVREYPEDLRINLIHSQEFNRTALMLVARSGHVDLIEILLQHPEIDVNLQDMNGMTALYLAAREDHYEASQLLLDAKANVDIVDFHAGRSPLRCAAERNHPDTVDLLLQYGADPALMDREGGTAMLRAVNRGAKEALEKMMEYPVDVTCVDEDGQSLLHGAARNGYHEIARLLMDNRLPDEGSPEVRSLDPNIRDKYDQTPLHDASRRGHAAVASILLEKGANPILEDRFGRDPFTVGWQYGHDNITAILAKCRDSGEHCDDLNETKLPLWSMARRGLLKAVADFIKTRSHEILVKEPCTENTPLHCAVEADEPDILSMLLGMNVLPVNERNHFGRTPLHFAALEGDLLASKLLLDHGADVNVKDRWMDEALVLAQSNGHMDLMLLLLDVRAVVNKQKIDTKRLFFHAVEQGRTDSVRILIEQHRIDRSMQNPEGVRAMQIANATENAEMIRLLKSAPTVNFRDVVHNNNTCTEADDCVRYMYLPFRSRPVEL